MSDVVDFPGVTTGRVEPHDVLEGFKEEGLEEVILIGWDEDGNMRMGMSSGDVATNVLLLETAKTTLINSLIIDY